MLDPTRERIDPDRCGLVVFDMLETYRDKIESAEVVGPIKRLIELCRGQGVPIFYARADHRHDGRDFGRVLTDTDADFVPWSDNHQPPDHFPYPQEGMVVIPEFAPQPGDVDVPKHRWNAFYQTHLELSLRTAGRDTVILIGGSAHVGIASTAFAARDMDFHVVIVSDCLTGAERQRTFFIDSVFPRMARVRTVVQMKGEFVA